MIGILGLSQTAPLALWEHLGKKAKKFNLTRKIALATTPATNLVPAKSKRTIVYFCFGTEAFIKNLRSFSLNRAIVLLFDASEKLAECKNLVHLDSTKPATNKRVLLAMAEAMANNTSVVPIFKTENYIQAALDRNKHSGFLHQFNALFYKIPSKSIRAVIKLNLIAWISGRSTAEAFGKRAIESAPARGKVLETVQALVELVKDDEGVRLQKAVTEARAANVDVEKLAEDNNVSAYDIRYMLAQLKKEPHGSGKKPARKAGPSKPASGKAGQGRAKR